MGEHARNLSFFCKIYILGGFETVSVCVCSGGRGRKKSDMLAGERKIRWGWDKGVGRV